MVLGRCDEQVEKKGTEPPADAVITLGESSRQVLFKTGPNFSSCNPRRTTQSAAFFLKHTPLSARPKQIANK